MKEYYLLDGIFFSYDGISVQMIFLFDPVTLSYGRKPYAIVTLFFLKNEKDIEYILFLQTEQFHTKKKDFVKQECKNIIWETVLKDSKS